MKFCPGCDTLKSISKFYISKTGKHVGKPRPKCIKCENLDTQKWRDNHPGYEAERSHIRGQHKPQSENKECPGWLGIHVAENLLPGIFKNVVRMPNRNPGYDFICGLDLEIDVKSSCLRYDGKRAPKWNFAIRRNPIAKAYFCIGFDDRICMNPMHVWLIPANRINMLMNLSISNTPASLSKWAKYEKSVIDVVNECEAMKNRQDHGHQ